MKRQQLYPELIDYIYEYLGKFKTQDEILAGHTITIQSKRNDRLWLEFHKAGGRYSDDPKIQMMIADGFEAFKNRVVVRIYREHFNKLELNLCAKCGKIARTPEAKQCRFCYYDWH